MRSKNRIRKLYDGYDKALKPYKIEMKKVLEGDTSLAVAIIIAYRAEKIRLHYWRVIGYFGMEQRQAYKEFCKTKLQYKMMCGSDGFWKTLRLCGYEDIFRKYHKAIPEQKAFGEIYQVAMNVVNRNLKKTT